MKLFIKEIGKLLLLALATLILFYSCSNLKQESTSFSSNWPEAVHRTWIGPEYWANRLQDW